MEKYPHTFSWFSVVVFHLGQRFLLTFDINFEPKLKMDFLTQVLHRKHNEIVSLLVYYLPTVLSKLQINDVPRSMYQLLYLHFQLSFNNYTLIATKIQVTTSRAML